jgi:hypothetical protein
MTQEDELKERSLWLKRKIAEAEAEEMMQKQREYPHPRKTAFCDHYGICQSLKKRCPDCED